MEIVLMFLNQGRTSPRRRNTCKKESSQRQDFPQGFLHAYMCFQTRRLIFYRRSVPCYTPHCPYSTNTNKLNPLKSSRGKAKVITSIIYIFLKRSAHTNVKENYGEQRLWAVKPKQGRDKCAANGWGEGTALPAEITSFHRDVEIKLWFGSEVLGPQC